MDNHKNSMLGIRSCTDVSLLSPEQIQGEAKASVTSVVKYRGVFGTLITMVRTEGPRSLYSGLVAGLQRQMSFASVRIGLYDSVKQFYTKGSDREYCERL